MGFDIQNTFTVRPKRGDLIGYEISIGGRPFTPVTTDFVDELIALSCGFAQIAEAMEEWLREFPAEAEFAAVTMLENLEERLRGSVSETAAQGLRVESVEGEEWSYFGKPADHPGAADPRADALTRAMSVPGPIPGSRP